MKRFAAVSLILMIGPLGACEPRSAPAPAGSGTPADPATASYVAASMAADGVTLHVRVTAPEARPLYLENCNGAFPWGLERPDEGAWTTAWVAELNGCLSEPIVVPPGEHRDFRLPIRLRPSDSLPAGTYRVALYALHDTYDMEPDASNKPGPLENRVSDPFPLRPLPGP
jgi:hypothetical protein